MDAINLGNIKGPKGLKGPRGTKFVYTTTTSSGISSIDKTDLVDGDIVISDDCLLYKCVVSNDSKTLELIKSEDSSEVSDNGIAIKGKEGPKGYSLDKTITNIVFSEKQITDEDGSEKTIYGMSYTGTYNTIA